MRVDVCRRSSDIRARLPASLWAKIKSFLEAMMEMCGYGRFAYDLSYRSSLFFSGKGFIHVTCDRIM
jgi:hypothetical protein